MRMTTFVFLFNLSHSHNRCTQPLRRLSPKFLHKTFFWSMKIRAGGEDGNGREEDEEDEEDARRRTRKATFASLFQEKFNHSTVQEAFCLEITEEEEEDD